MTLDVDLQKEIQENIKCKFVEKPRICRNKVLLKSVNSLKWTSQKGEEKHRIRLNPLNQSHPSIYFRKPPSDLRPLRRDIWDAALYETERVLDGRSDDKIKFQQAFGSQPAAGAKTNYKKSNSFHRDAEGVFRGSGDGQSSKNEDPNISSLRDINQVKIQYPSGGVNSVLRGSGDQQEHKSSANSNLKYFRSSKYNAGITQVNRQTDKDDFTLAHEKPGKPLRSSDVTRWIYDPTRRAPLPLAAVNKRYEDPYSNQHAEMKLLSGKGVNFFVCSRSHFNSKQLAKKIALEMNCLLIDPMEIIESYYQRTIKGFYIPPKIKETLQGYLCEKFSSELCGTLCVLKSLMTYFSAQSSGLEERCKDIASQKISIDSNLEKLSTSLPRRIQSSRKSNECSRGSRRSSKKSEENRNQCHIDNVSQDVYQENEVRYFDNHPIVCFLKREMKRSFCIGDIVDALGDLPPREAEEIIDYILSLETRLFSRLDTSAYIRPLCKAITMKNYSSLESVLKEWIMKRVECFDAYTRGYVLVYDPSISENNKDVWSSVFSSLNPPDVLIFGQCPVDELNTNFEVLRVNPFLPYEYYHYEFRQNFRHKSTFYAHVMGLEETEVLNYITDYFKDRNVPIEESLVYEYYQIIQRRHFLCQLSEVCLAIKSSPLPDIIGEDFQGIYSGENFDYNSKQDPDNTILNLENYVKLPKVITTLTNQFNDTFSIDSLLMTAVLNCHSSCVVRTDVRTPISYQYSIVKRWFDCSGFYSKPRARCGNLAKLSVMCELIGRGVEQRKLNDEFLMEYNEKINAAKKSGYDEHEYMEDAEEFNLFKSKKGEKSIYMEGEEFQNEWMEEGMFISAVVSSAKSSTIRTLSEFDSINRIHGDEFYYLHKDFEDKFSFLVDLQELNSRDNSVFFRTYQYIPDPSRGLSGFTSLDINIFPAQLLRCNFTVWEDRCPVAHREGKCRLGFLEFAVRLHDKVYYMSTLQAMKAFMYQPSKYLVPLLPASQCSVLVVGKPIPAKTYLSEAIATFFGASVIDYNNVIAKAQEELKNIYLQSATNEVIELLKSVFSENVSSDYKKECDILVDWLDKSYQLILFRKLIFKPLFWNIYPPELYDEPDGEMYSISEFYPPKNSSFDLNRLCKRGQVKDLIMDIFFKTFQKYSDYMNIEPYFLEGCPEEVLNYDILLDTLLREQFKNMGLIDIYGNYDMCDFYAWYPYRLLERLPIDLIPRHEPMCLEEDAKIRNDIVQFLFPLNTVPLSVREKIDAIGTEIVAIERNARLSEQVSYGGWVINGMPINVKLFKGLNKAGIFPYNVVYVDDPNLFYNQFENMHIDEDARRSDIEKNLVCYISPKLRMEILPLSKKLPKGLNRNENQRNLTDKLKEEEFIQNLGCKVARTYEKFQAFVRLHSASMKNKSLADWPGKKGLKSQLGRNNLYESITNHPDYDNISDLGFQKALDLFELIYTKYARSNFKPLYSLAAIHVVTASKYRSFLYNSKKFKKKKIKNRIFKLMDSFFEVVKEDNYISECIKFVSFKFYYEEISTHLPPTKVPQINMNFSYLYHLAYAIENSMFMCDDLNQIFKQIYTILRNLGFSLGINRECMPKLIELSHATWEEKDKNRKLLHIEKRLRIHSKIIDYEYIMSKILELERSMKSSKESLADSNVSIEPNLDFSDHGYSLSQSLSTLKSNVNKVQCMGIKALRTLLEFDSSFLISTNDEYSKFILYFPENLSFMIDQEKAYDMCLITNKKFHNSQDISDKDYDLNTILILFEDSVWDNWKFVHAEDYGDLQSFWERKDGKDFNLTSQIKNPFEIISREKGFHFLKKVVSIQNRIDFLRKRKGEYLCSNEEQLLLDYLIWIRNEYFRRYLIGVVDLPSKIIGGQPIKSNMPNISSFCNQLTKYNESTKSTKIDIEYETWPFRSNYKSLPKFIGIYDCILWNEISQVRMKKQKFVVNKAKLSSPTGPSSSSEIIEVASVLKNDLVKEMTDFILHDLNTFKFFDFNKELSKFKNDRNLNCESLLHKCFFDKSKQTNAIETRTSNTKELFFKNEFILIENDNSNKHRKNKNSIQKDGPRNYRPIRNNVILIKDANKKQENIEDVKQFVFDSSVVSKINWISIDDLGPFNVLYTVLNSIRGSRGLPKVTGTALPIEKVNESTASNEGIFQSQSEEEDIKIRGAKEITCIVCLFDGEMKYGMEGLSVQLLGQTFHFCSQECFIKFRLSSELYVNVLKTYENIIPFYIFYLELPGGVGRNVCSLLSYYFKINMFYMDDYLLQRFRTKNIDNDIKFISIKKKLVTCFNSEYHKQIEDNENFLWSYLIQESDVPRLPKLIENCWKKEKHFCIYNFPHYPNSLKQTAKKCFIPNVIIKSSRNSLKKMMEFKNVDFIKCYAADLYNDKNRITKLYFLDFKWWMANWQARFLKMFKIIKREEIFQLISSLQFNLTTSLKTITIDRFGFVKPITPPVPLDLWSGASFPFYEKSDAKESKNESSEGNLFNFSTKLFKSFGERDNISRESPFACKEQSDSETSKDKGRNEMINCHEDGNKSKLLLKSTRFELPNTLKWKTNLKDSFEYEELKHLNDKQSYKKLCQNVKNQLKREINNELLFRENVKQTICSKKTFSDDEINLKSEVLSVDSVGFEDYDNIKIENEDLKKDNALRTLTIALKHANSSNPIPAPTLDKFYDDANTQDLNIFSDCQIQAYEATVDQFQSLFDGVENPSFDILKHNFEFLISNVKQAKKQTVNSECVIEIDRDDVEKLLETGYYFLSNFGRQCPVQSRRGFLYPMPTIMYDSSNCYPVVHRRYMYFLSSKNALEAFKDDPLEFVDKAEYNPPIPIKAIFFGPNTKRTNYIINYLAREYSLEHISVSRALEHFIRRGSWTRLGQRLKWQSSYIYGLPYPVKLPTSILWQAVLSLTSSPKSASHGFIISGLRPNAELIHIWNQCHFKPHIIFYMTVDNSDLLALQQRQEIVSNFDSMGRKVRHFEFVKNSYMMNMLGCTNSEISTWETILNNNCVGYIKKFYSNVNMLDYYSSIHTLCCGMSSAVLGLIKQIRLFYNLTINGSEDPIPVGNLISFKHYTTLKNEVWGNSCPVCVCTSGRYLPNYPKFFQPGIILRKGKTYWVCKKHIDAFISSSEEYAGNFDLKLQLSNYTTENMILSSETIFGFNGFCPVCYWVQKPHLEYQYRCGSSKFFQFYNKEAYKFCSAFCLSEFISAPWLYAFIGKCKFESNILPHVDTKYWSEFDMKNFHENYIYLRDVKGIFFYDLMRLAANLNVISPGLSKRETRLFFIYALARRYMAGSVEANNWKQVIVEFLFQSGVSRKIVNKFLYAEEKDMEITEMIEYFASVMTA